jgi:hypothetical protein
MITDNTLRWVEKILKERLNDDLILQRNELGYLLKIDGINAGIQFTSDFPVNCNVAADLPCTFWNANTEGSYSLLNIPLIAPGASKLQSPLVHFVNHLAFVRYDVVGLIYWMFLRIEENKKDCLDAHARFPAIESHAFKHNYLERPIVDEWLYVVGELLKITIPSFKLKKHSFNFSISHDVDRPSRFGFNSIVDLALNMGIDFIKYKKISSLYMGPLIRLKTSDKLYRRDPYNTFEYIMDISEACNIKSTFYFICGNTSKRYDSDYYITDPSIVNLIKKIKLRGHEVGLHPSYNSSNDLDVILHEAKQLRKVLIDLDIKQESIGSRMHYLRWSHQDTLIFLDEAKIAYDTTLGYADHVGFRCGTCFDYPGFNIKKDQILNIRIRPLIVMDGTITGYMKFGLSTKGFQKIMHLMSICELYKGNFTLLWHNCSLLNAEERLYYESILFRKNYQN